MSDRYGDLLIDLLHLPNTQENEARANQIISEMKAAAKEGTK